MIIIIVQIFSRIIQFLTCFDFSDFFLDESFQSLVILWFSVNNTHILRNPAILNSLFNVILENIVSFPFIPLILGRSQYSLQIFFKISPQPILVNIEETFQSNNEHTVLKTQASDIKRHFKFLSLNLLLDIFLDFDDSSTTLSWVLDSQFLFHIIIFYSVRGCIDRDKIPFLFESSYSQTINKWYIMFFLVVIFHLTFMSIKRTKYAFLASLVFIRVWFVMSE